MRLSKSKYVRGLQCPKLLWFDQHFKIEKIKDIALEEKLEVGRKIGELAQKYFGSEVQIVPFSYQEDEMIAKTQKFLENGAKVIAEASFEFDGNFCSVDILRRLENDTYEIIEVKSSGKKGALEKQEKWQKRFNNPKKELKSKYEEERNLNDISYQYYVLTESGLNISKVSLMHLNNEYELQGDSETDLETEKLFTIIDHTEEAKVLRVGIEDVIEELKQIATSTREPHFVGTRCDKCQHKEHCFEKARIPKRNNVFDIGWGLGKGADKIYDQGRGPKTFEQVWSKREDIWQPTGKSKDISDAAKCQMRQVETALKNLKPHIDKEALKNFLEEISYPVYHLDFEFYTEDLPKWHGAKPIEKIVFQYSVHIEHADGTYDHQQFLNPAGTDPAKAVATKLCEHIPIAKGGSVIVYSKAAENGCLEKLAEKVPELAEQLMLIKSKIIDINEPFSKGYYYSKEIGETASLKSVYPALCPDDKQYYDLEVSNGGIAMHAYMTLSKKTKEEQAKIIEQLYEYCALDTYATMKIHQKLRELLYEE